MKYTNGLDAQVLDRVKMLAPFPALDHQAGDICDVQRIFPTMVRVDGQDYVQEDIQFIRRPPAPDAAIDIMGIVENIHSRLSDRHRMTGDTGLFKPQLDLINEAILELKPLTGQHARMHHALTGIKELLDPIVDNKTPISSGTLTAIMFHLRHGLEPRQEL